MKYDKRHRSVCQCEGPNKRDNWKILNYKCNFSAFNGYNYTPSDYSQIICSVCGHIWRTKAQYVENLPFYNPEK